MAFKSEFATWRDELQPPPKPTIAERVAKWFSRPGEPERDHFEWVSVSEVVPVAGEEP